MDRQRSAHWSADTSACRDPADLCLRGGLNAVHVTQTIHILGTRERRRNRRIRIWEGCQRKQGGAGGQFYVVSPRQMLQQYLTSYLRLLKSVSKRWGPIRVKTLLHKHRSLNFLVFSPFRQCKAFFSFSFGADSLLVHICADLPLRNCSKHPWIRVSAHGSRRRDINMMFTHQLNLLHSNVKWYSKNPNKFGQSQKMSIITNILFLGCAIWSNGLISWLCKKLFTLIGHLSLKQD
jgi:hypothetical protein